jgi:hypothetical protein
MLGADIISRCVWLYYRFGVSLRDVSELLLTRGIEVLIRKNPIRPHSSQFDDVVGAKELI